MRNTSRFDKTSSKHVLIVVPDANVLIHGKPLANLPWEELGRPELEIVFVPPMIRELDKLKIQAGRTSKVARQLSSDIRALIDNPNGRAEIRRINPIVRKRVDVEALTQLIHPQLQLDHADRALINYACWLKQGGADVLLLTNDTICGVTAKEVGLPTFFLPDHWLREPEADELSKENKKLKAEIQRLSSADPKVEVTLRHVADLTASSLEVSFTRWPPLSEAQIGQLMTDIERCCPLATDFKRPVQAAYNSNTGGLAQGELVSRLSTLGSPTVYIPATAQEIERYRRQDYPKWLEKIRGALETLHVTLQAQTLWPTVVAKVCNNGSRPAVEVLLAMRARGALLMMNAAAAEQKSEETQDAEMLEEEYKLPHPPNPPRGRLEQVGFANQYFRLLASVASKSSNFPADYAFPLSYVQQQHRNPETFYWLKGKRDWVDEMAVECDRWRHGREISEFKFHLRPASMAETKGMVEVDFHASNIPDVKSARLPVHFQLDEGKTFGKAQTLVQALDKQSQINEFIETGKWRRD